MNVSPDTPLSNPPNTQSVQNSSNATKYVFITVTLFIALLTGTVVYFWQQLQVNTMRTQFQSELNGLKQKITTVEKEKKEIEQITCKGVWKNGICIQSSCIDSDVNEKPNDKYIKGSVTYTDENGVSTTVYDECSGSKRQVNEMWCYESPSGSGNYVPGKMLYNCINGCLDGSCIK
jgi:hypothetical protein